VKIWVWLLEFGVNRPRKKNKLIFYLFLQSTDTRGMADSPTSLNPANQTQSDLSNRKKARRKSSLANIHAPAPISQEDIVQGTTSAWMNPLIKSVSEFTAIHGSHELRMNKQHQSWVTPGFLYPKKESTELSPKPESSNSSSTPPARRNTAIAMTSLQENLKFVLVGDVYIRRFMKSGDAVFRVTKIEGQFAYDKNGTVVKISELLTATRYENLFVGEQGGADPNNNSIQHLHFQEDFNEYEDKKYSRVEGVEGVEGVERVGEGDEQGEEQEHGEEEKDYSNKYFGKSFNMGMSGGDSVGSVDNVNSDEEWGDENSVYDKDIGVGVGDTDKVYVGSSSFAAKSLFFDRYRVYADETKITAIANPPKLQSIRTLSPKMSLAPILSPNKKVKMGLAASASTTGLLGGTGSGGGSGGGSKFAMSTSKSMTTFGTTVDKSMNPETIKNLLEISQTDPSTLLNDAIREARYNPSGEISKNMQSNDGDDEVENDFLKDETGEEVEFGTLGGNTLTSTNALRKPSYSWAQSSPHPLELDQSFLNDSNSRPTTGSFGYLDTCNKKNVTPWSLMTKCESGSGGESKLNLRGLSIGKDFGNALSVGLKSRSMDFLQRIDFSGNRLSGENVESLLESLSGKAVVGLDLSDNSDMKNLGGRAVVEFLDNNILLKEVSERSERALRKTRILAMNPAKWLQTATSTTKLTHSILLTRFHSFCSCFIKNAPRFRSAQLKLKNCVLGDEIIGGLIGVMLENMKGCKINNLDLGGNLISGKGKCAAAIGECARRASLEEDEHTRV